MWIFPTHFSLIIVLDFQETPDVLWRVIHKHRADLFPTVFVRFKSTHTHTHTHTHRAAVTCAALSFVSFVFISRKDST